MSSIHTVIKSIFSSLNSPKKLFSKTQTMFFLCVLSKNNKSFYKYNITLSIMIEKEVFSGTFTLTDERAEGDFTFLRLNHAEFQKNEINSIQQALLSKTMQPYEVRDQKDFIALANSLIAKKIPHLQSNVGGSVDKDVVLKTISEEFQALFDNKGSEAFRDKLNSHFVIKEKQEIENSIIGAPEKIKKVVKI